MRALFLTLALLITPATAFAEEGPTEFGPAIGSALPSVTYATPEGIDAATLDLYGEKGATLVISRSLQWCPVCKSQASEMLEQKAAFDGLGYPLVFITTDDAEKLTKIALERAEEAGSTLFLGDVSRSLIIELGIADPVFAGKAQGHRFYALPFPTTLIVHKDGTIAAKLFEADEYGQSKGYVERIDAETTLNAIRDLS
jgi:peroxiredoxin